MTRETNDSLREFLGEFSLDHYLQRDLLVLAVVSMLFGAPVSTSQSFECSLLNNQSSGTFSAAFNCYRLRQGNDTNLDDNANTSTPRSGRNSFSAIGGLVSSRTREGSLFQRELLMEIKRHAERIFNFNGRRTRGCGSH